MRAAVLGQGGRLEIRDLPIPAAGPDDMLIRTVSCGLCGSDLFKIRNGSIAPGTVLGHEIVGVVMTGPPHALALCPPGARVTVSNHIPCGKCGFCRRDRISMCSQFRSTHVDPGGFAEFVRIPSLHVSEGVIRIPESMSDDRALLAEPLGCCLRAMDRWPAASGEPVLVVGLGPVGLLMVLLLRHLGAVPFGVDPLEERRAMGIEKGCEEVCVPEDLEQWGAMGGVVLTACSGRTVEMALRKVEGGGWIGLFAGPREDVPVPVQLQSLYKNEVELIPSYSTGPFHMRRALELLHGGTLDVDGLFTHQFPIQEIQRAVELAEAQTGFKALLRF